MLASRSLTSVDVTHPSERGALIFEQFLCGDLTQTPSAEQHTKPARNVGETPRDWLARVTRAGDVPVVPSGRSIPLGVAFEHYAYSGAWRDTDGGLALDARGDDRRDRHRGQLRRRAPAHRPPRAQPRCPCLSRPQVDGDRLWPARRRRGRVLAGRAGAGRSRAPAATSATSARSHPDRGVPLQACAMKPPSKLRLTRRSVLKGAGGIAIALPWLEAMTRGDRPGPPRRQTRPSVSSRSTPRAARSRKNGRRPAARRTSRCRPSWRRSNP